MSGTVHIKVHFKTNSHHPQCSHQYQEWKGDVPHKQSVLRPMAARCNGVQPSWSGYSSSVNMVGTMYTCTWSSTWPFIYNITRVYTFTCMIQTLLMGLKGRRYQGTHWSLCVGLEAAALWSCFLHHHPYTG